MKRLVGKWTLLGLAGSLCLLLGIVATSYILSAEVPAPKITVVKTTKIAQTTGASDMPAKPTSPGIIVETCTEQLVKEIASVKYQQQQILDQLRTLTQLAEEVTRGNVGMRYKLEELKNGINSTKKR